VAVEPRAVTVSIEKKEIDRSNRKLTCVTAFTSSTFSVSVTRAVAADWITVQTLTASDVTAAQSTAVRVVESEVERTTVTAMTSSSDHIALTPTLTGDLAARGVGLSTSRVT